MSKKTDFLSVCRTLLVAVYGIVIAAVANSYLWVKNDLSLLYFAVPLFLFISVFSGGVLLKTARFRLRVCAHGASVLKSFLIAAVFSVVFHIVMAFRFFTSNLWQEWLWSALVCIGVLALYFWNGILSVYLFSVQMGIKQRVLGALFGMVPIINLILLGRIIITVEKEIRFETEKEKLNKSRRDERLCETRYPILLVHGVFFRDIKYFNYWGRVPKELQLNGATVFYGNHASASSVASSAEELSVRIKEILRETGAEKVNIVAHSKGGLDCRYAISQLGMAPYVASLTTVNTPHKGCVFADELLTRIPIDLQTKVANAYNKTLRKLGEPQADFLAAVNDLTAKSCKEREPMMQVPAGVYCQSVGSVMPRHSGGKFPLNLSYHLVKYFDGANDGLVSVDSFRWGENFTLLTPTGKRGISHGDMIDLNRENIEGFDVREFYVSLINGLKKKGY